MKSSHLTFLLALLFLSTSVFGQRLKDKRVTFNFVSLPSEKLPDDYLTYSARFYGYNHLTAGMTLKNVEKSIKMDGFKRVPDEGQNGGGHLRIIMNTGVARLGQAEFKSKKNTHKDKETGKETYTYEYWYEVPVTSMANYKIVDPEGNVLHEQKVNCGDIAQTKHYSNSTTLRKNYKSLMATIKKNFAKKSVNTVSRSAGAYATKNYDFDHAKDNETFYTIVKHETEKDFNKYYEQLKKEMPETGADIPTEELKAKFGDALAFYEGEADKDAPSDKKLKRVFKAANYNAAILNFYMDDFEKAVHYANRVIANDDGKHKPAEKLIERVQEIKSKMEVHGVNTMHYSRDVADAVPPSVLKAIELEMEEMEEDNDLLEGTIVVDGKEVKGRFVSEKESDELSFGEKGNTSFMVQEGAEKTDYDLTSANISAFSIGERSFVKMNFAPCAKGKSEPNSHILEKMYTSDKINLYKYYPEGGALSDGKVEYAYKKAADENPVSLYDTQFLIFKKGLANYFSDCADLKGLCEEGSIENNEEGLMQAARIYAEVCQ